MTGDVLEIRVEGRVIRGRPVDDPVGLFVRKNGFQGWEGLSTSRREALARAVAHGEHDVPVYLPARVVTIDGWVLTRTVDDLRRYSHRVSGLGATGRRLRLEAAHQGETLWAMGRRLVGEVEDQGLRRGRLLRAQFQLQFVCADPRKYGNTAKTPEVGVGTVLDVAHWGNFPAFPVIEIPAAPASYTISSPAGTFTVAGAIPGGTHRIDMRTGRVTRDDVPMFGVGRGAVWAVPDGARWTHTLSVPGRVLITDTFI